MNLLFSLLDLFQYCQTQVLLLVIGHSLLTGQCHDLKNSNSSSSYQSQDSRALDAIYPPAQSHHLKAGMK